MGVLWREGEHGTGRDEGEGTGRVYRECGSKIEGGIVLRRQREREGREKGKGTIVDVVSRSEVDSICCVCVCVQKAERERESHIPTTENKSERLG